LVLGEFTVLSSDQGCDYGGDGLADNAFALAMRGTRGPLNRFVNGSIVTGYTLVAIELLDLAPDFWSGGDDSLFVAFDEAADGDDIAGNEMTGDGALLVDARSLRPDGWPRQAMQARIESGQLVAHG